MAVTAKFQADFSSFIAAIDKAELALVDFGKGANKVESSLNRMVDNFSGRKLIQEASLLTIAVEKIGGVSALTAKELENVGTKANDAVDKLKRMGSDVPLGLQRLADETKNVTKAHTDLSSTVRGLITDFAAMFTARAAFNFVKQTINEASALQDLSNQTHISVEEIQLLAGSMSEFGVDADTLGRGLFKLSRGIAGGDESVAAGLHLMGLSLKDVEGLNGKELFLKIENGLATLQGGLRDTAAADLFGGKLGAAMAGASEGIQGTLEKWQALNKVASHESVEAMDTFGESIARANKNLSSIASNMIGPLAQGFNVINDAVNKGPGKWAIFVAIMKDFAASNSLSGASTANLAKLLDDLNISTDASKKATEGSTNAHQDAVVALDAHGQAAKFMAALELDSAKPLLQWQVDYLAHLKEIGLLDEKHAAGVGVTAAQFKNYTAEVENNKKALEENKRVTKEWDDLLTHLHQETFKLAQEHEKAWREQSIKNTERSNAAILAEFDAQTKLNAEWGLNAAGAIQVQGTALDALNIKLAALHDNRVEGISQEKQEQALMKEYTDALLKAAQAQDVQTMAVARTTQGYWAQVDAELAAIAAASGGTISSTGTRVGTPNDGTQERGPGINHTPTVPINSFARGGPTGRGGLAILHAGEFVVPKDGALVGGSGGPQIIQLVVDGRVLAEVVEARQTKSMKQSRQFPSN